MRTEPSNKPDTAHPPYRRRCRWLSLVLMIVVFVSGALVGSGLTIIFKPQRALFGHKTLEERRDRLVEWIDRDVGLSDKQKEQVGKIVLERFRELRELRKIIQSQQEIQAHLLHDKVAALLDDDQQDKWRKWWQERFKEWFPQPAATQPTTAPAESLGLNGERTGWISDG